MRHADQYKYGKEHPDPHQWEAAKTILGKMTASNALAWLRQQYVKTDDVEKRLHYIRIGRAIKMQQANEPRGY